MVEPKREQFRRFLCLLGSNQNRWLNSILIDVKTHKDSLSYLHSCVKEELQIYMSISLRDGGPSLSFLHSHDEREYLDSLVPKEIV